MNASTHIVPSTVFDVENIRKDFPILHQEVNGKPLVYMDNGATSQKPQSVINSLVSYYSEYNSNVHRGVHTLSQKATGAYEDARKTMCEFIGAGKTDEIIFTKGTTDSINLVASSMCQGLKPGDRILISTMEHHSNIVPWQIACKISGAKLDIIPIDDNGDIDLSAYRSLLTNNTKLVGCTHVSNTLGTINPVKEITRLAHDAEALVLLDGAQAVPHVKVDVTDLDCDFYAFSGHKMYGPTGIGVLYGKDNILNELPPYQGGGDMIDTVTFEHTTYNQLPYKFEAGTPNIAGAIGLATAVEYLHSIDFLAAAQYEKQLLDYATAGLAEIKGLQIIGTAKNKAAVLSMSVEGIHHYDLGTILDQLGVAVRTGHHCTEPLMVRFGISGTTRASLAFYNTFEEIDILINSIQRALKMLK